MKKEPLVSVIIPTYNRAHLIGETLDSVLAQTYQNWECIIVDDGSSDDTNEVVGVYVKKDSRFKFYHRPDKHLPGGNGARNYGFKMSQGEYIQWFDSDDLMRKEFLDFKLKSINETSSIVISNRFENGEAKDQRRPRAGEFNIDRFDRLFIMNRYFVLTGDVLIYRSLINQYFDEKLRSAQEMEFFTRIFDQQINYVFLDERLWDHKTYIDSISSSRSINQENKIDSLIYLSKKLRKKYQDDYEVFNTVRNYAVKMFKSLILKNKTKTVFQNFSFFKETYGINSFHLFFYILYSTIARKGFDRLKKIGLQNFNKPQNT